MSVGLVEATTGVIGESDNEIGGLNITRLTQAVPQVQDLVAVYTWAGTTTITTPDTSEVVVGDYIKLGTDNQWFKIITVTLNTSVEIENPSSLTIPTGATTSARAVVSIPVETTLDWSDSGSLLIDGVKYSYTSKTLAPVNPSFNGLTHVIGGVTTPGLKKAHRLQSSVVDVSKAISALDLVRRSMLVDYAEEEYLSAIGSNHGVPRLPSLGDDEAYRNVVKALAYNPRGTLFGLELALDGIVGAGNYELYENVITYPNTVFVRLIGDAANNEKSQGKAFLTGPESNPATSSTTVDIQNSIADRGHVGSVRWKDENHLTEVRAAYPTADLISEYTGETPKVVWVIGASHVEGTDVTLISADSGVLEFTTSTGAIYYRHAARIQSETVAAARMLFNVPTAGTLLTTYRTGVRISDTDAFIGFGVRDGPTGATMRVAFADLDTGVIVGSNIVTINRDQYYDIEIRKNGTGDAELWVDGVFQFSEPYASFPAASNLNHHVDWGRFTTGDTQMRVKDVGFFATTLFDHWALQRSSKGIVNPASPGELDTQGSTPGFQDPDDVGKAIIIYNSIVTNAQGGNNNGKWIIESVDTYQIVTVTGPQNQDASFSSAIADRIIVGTDDVPFQFPDDLGKTIVIESGSNAGSYVIDTLLDEDTLVDLASYDTQIPQKTRICEVASAPAWVTELEVSWHLEPNFVAETELAWVMADAGSYVGATLTLRDNLPLPSGTHRVLDVIYSQVLSAQVLLNNTLVNEVTQESPLEFSYYPFYIADPLGFVRTYLDAITAAGVIPEFLII